MGDSAPNLNELWTSPERDRALRQDTERYANAARHLTRALLEALEVPAGARVLDLACGPGDPTLALAEAVGPTGSVTGADISEGALEVGRELARRRGVTNVEFRRADARQLPFDSESFDRLDCRFGAMFFDDLATACAEMHRVLRPGGRAAYMVWGPAEQPHFDANIGVLLRRLKLRSLPDPYSTPFRFAARGALEAALATAGFGSVRAQTVTIDWVWDGSPEELARSWMETVVFWRPFLDQIPPKERPDVEREITEYYHRYWREGAVRIPDVVRIVTAHR